MSDILRHPQMLAEISELLHVNDDQLSGVLGVSKDYFDLYNSGERTASDFRVETRIETVYGAVTRLTRLIRRDRLADLIRRPAKRFDGSTAIDLILRGQIHDVLLSYERALSYQA